MWISALLVISARAEHAEENCEGDVSEGKARFELPGARDCEAFVVNFTQGEPHACQPGDGREHSADQQHEQQPIASLQEDFNTCRQEAEGHDQRGREGVEDPADKFNFDRLGKLAVNG